MVVLVRESLDCAVGPCFCTVDWWSPWPATGAEGPVTGSRRMGAVDEAKPCGRPAAFQPFNIFPTPGVDVREPAQPQRWIPVSVGNSVETHTITVQ